MLVGGTIYNIVTTQEITAMVVMAASGSGLGFKILQNYVNSFAKIVLDSRITLDYFLEDQEEACALTNISCCFYVNPSAAIEGSSTRLLDKANWLTENINLISLNRPRIELNRLCLSSHVSTTSRYPS